MNTVQEGCKDYKSESSSKSFSDMGDLKIHIYTIHEGHKDLKCYSCSKSGSHVKSLKQHIHTVQATKITNVNLALVKIIVIKTYVYQGCQSMKKPSKNVRPTHLIKLEVKPHLKENLHDITMHA